MAVNLKRSIMDAYTKIAEDYDRFRRKPFKEVELFLSKPRTLILDIGTGNGRNLLIRGEVFKRAVGIDLCRSMLNLARKNLHEHGLWSKVSLVLADATSLPFRECVFDACVNTAVLHHVSSSELGKAINDAVRVLKIGGELLCSVWDKREIETRASEKEEGGYVVKWGNVRRIFIAYDVRDLIEISKSHTTSSVFKAYPNCYMWLKKHS